MKRTRWMARRSARRNVTPFLTVAALAMTMAVAAVPGTARAAVKPERPLPYQPGETIHFHIRYLAMRVGEAEVTITSDPSRDLWPIEARAWTRGLFGRLHPMEQEFRSLFDPDQVRATGSDLRFEEKGKLRTERVRIDGEQAQVLIRHKGKVTDEVREVLPEAHDILSAIFHLRALPMKVGDVLTVPIFTGHNSWMLTAKVEKRERVSTDHASMPALVLSCRTHFKGKFESSKALRVWISDDDLRVPVRIDAEFALGTLRATMSGYRRGLVTTSSK